MSLPRGWVQKEVGEIARISSGGTPSKSNPLFWSGTVPWFSAKGLKTFALTDSIDHITEAGAAAGCGTVPAGTLLVLTRGMTLFKDLPVGITRREAAFNKYFKWLQVRSGYDAEFLGYWLVARKGVLLAKVEHAGHGTGRLPTEALSEMVVTLPSELMEQRKIGGILRTWDDALRKLELLVTAKRRHKGGLMQQMLTGQVRFKEFEGARWRKVRIGDLLQEVDRYVEFDDSDSYRLASVRRRSEGLFFREELRGSEIKTKVMKRIRTGDFLLSKMQVVHGAWGLVTPEFDGMFVSDSRSPDIAPR